MLRINKKSAMPSRSRTSRSRTIIRRAYSRRSPSSTRKIYVPASRITDRGLPGRGPRILPAPERGVLSESGYHHIKTLPEPKRHRLLRRALREHGYRKVIGHLTLLANYNHRTDPAAYAILKGDQQWVSRAYEKYKSRYGVQPYLSKAAKRRLGASSRSRRRPSGSSRSRSSKRSSSRR